LLTARNQPDSRFVVLAAGVVALIVYGSLYPFQFHTCTLSPAGLLSTSVIPADRGDLLSNVLLYMPLGFFVCYAWRGVAQAVLWATIAGGALSFAIELLQSCDNGRVPSMADICANAAGALIGSALAIGVGKNLSFAALLAAAWAGSRLLPYFPSIHLHKYWSAVRPLFDSKLSRLEVFHYFALWLTAAAVLDAIWQGQRWRLPLLVGAVLVGRVVVVDLALSQNEIVGALLAVVAWNAIALLPWRSAAVAAIFALFVVVQALEPFQFLREPRHFGWTPFLSFMQSPRENASRVFLEKSFTYGALVWLWVRAGMSFAFAASLAIALVFGLRVAQTYLPGRSAEITDALMVAMLAGTMKLMRT
jgi:VanZ family protein